MTLGDLLQELRENILHDRSDQVAGDTDQLWSDTTLIRYINEAQRRFARRSLVLRDGTTPARTRVQLVAGQDEYPLDNSVIAVLSARFSADKLDLLRAGHSLLGSYGSPDGRFFDTASYSGLPAGKTMAYSTDEEVGVDDDGRSTNVMLRVYPTPTLTYANTLQMRVVRIPCPLTIDDLNQECELPEDYHLDMLDWAAYLALRMVDLDTGAAGDAPNRAAGFKAAFEDHVVSAKREVMRKLFSPQAWGFGRGGFAGYER